MMDIMAQQKDCDVLAGLFQHIVTDLKVCAFRYNIFPQFISCLLLIHYFTRCLRLRVTQMFDIDFTICTLLC